MKKPSFFALLIVAMLIGCCTSVVAQTVHIPYQGYIADKSGKPYSGTFQFEFMIVGAGGNPVYWNSGAVSLPVAAGIYSVALGSTGQSALPAALFINNDDLYLRIAFNDGVRGKQTLAPDVKLLPVPYAVRAMYADTSFVQTALPPMDSLVLRDSRGVVRMVMNPNTGTFSMRNNDTTWYSLSVNSPPTETVNWLNHITEKTTYPNGDMVTTTRDSYTGKLEHMTTETKSPDGTKTTTHRDYVGGELEWERITTISPDGTVTRKEIWYYWFNGQKRSERTIVNGTTTSETFFTTTGQVEYQKIDSAGKKITRESYIGSNGKPWLTIEETVTAEGKTTKRTGYDENGQPKYEATTGSDGKYEYKNLEENKSSSGEAGTSTEKSGNSITTTEPGKVGITVNGKEFHWDIDDATGVGELWYVNPPSVDTPSIGFGGSGGGIEIETPVLRVNDGNEPPKKEATLDLKGDKPKLEFKWLLPPNFGQRSTFEWNPQNYYSITVSDSASGASTGILWDPIGRSVTSTNDITIGGSLKADTIKPKSKPTVTFPSGVTVNGQSFFGNTIDVAGAAQIQQNGTFTGAAAVVQNATVQQQLRANQIFPIAPATTVTINGNLNVVGNLTKGGGNFKIDHPLDPYNKYLIHSFVESPERTNIYSGNVVTDANGVGIVTLPAYFEAANTDFRYQLTAIGANARAWIATEINNNTFTVQTDIPNVKVSWQVTSTRTDNFAKSNPYSPEQEKEPEMKGKLLYPAN